MITGTVTAHPVVLFVLSLHTGELGYDDSSDEFAHVI